MRRMKFIVLIRRKVIARCVYQTRMNMKGKNYHHTMIRSIFVHKMQGRSTIIFSLFMIIGVLHC